MQGVRGLVRFVPPVVVGLGLAIMEVSSQARLHYFDAPILITVISEYVSPWFLGMIIVAAGAYLFALVGRVSWLGLFGYAMNTLAWEDVLYWLVRWHVPYGWVFYIHGTAIPYVVMHGIPIDTVIAIAISYVLIITDGNKLISKRNNKDAVGKP
jgi:hypothetical protein